MPLHNQLCTAKEVAPCYDLGHSMLVGSLGYSLVLIHSIWQLNEKTLRAR